MAKTLLPVSPIFPDTTEILQEQNPKLNAEYLQKLIEALHRMYDDMIAADIDLQNIDEDVNIRGVFALNNINAPLSTGTDKFKLWAQDITAGNSAPHFMTEDGSIIKLYQQSHISDPSGGTTVDSEARTAINYILDLLENAGLMASS